MDAALLKAISEGTLSPEVMAALEAKFKQQTVSVAPPPPPSPPPQMASSSKKKGGTNLTLGGPMTGSKKWKREGGGAGTDPSGSSTPDDGQTRAADPMQCSDIGEGSSSCDLAPQQPSKQHPLKGMVRKIPAQEKRTDKQDEEKIPLTCCGCRKVVAKASEFLLSHEGEGNCETWAGGHWGHCFECSRFNANDFENEEAELAARKKFTNAAKKSWMATTKQYKDLAIRARSITWQSFQARLKREMPNACDDERRKVCQERVRICVDTWMADFEKETEATQKARVEAHAKYIASLESMANDPMNSPAQKARGLKFVAEEAAWLTRVTEGFTVSFNCRNPNCRWYGMNDQWIVGARFRCPKCADEYWPWKAAKKNARGNTVYEYLPFQKVIHVTTLNEQWVIPALWPGSQADTWLLQQAEIYAAQLKVEGDLHAYMEDTLQKIEELCKKAGVPKGFKHYTWDPDVEARLDAVNYPRDGERGWGNLSENGFWGNELDALAEGESWNPFTNWSDLIQLIGRAMYCHRGLDITKA